MNTTGQIKCVAITGVSGFIGGELGRHYLKSGLRVIGLSRSNTSIAHENFAVLHYDLGKSFNEESLREADVIIHCAFVSYSTNQPNASEINIKATLELAEYCKNNKKKFVFLSSMSAHEEATSQYGSHKFYLENSLKKDHLVIKPGLVIGKAGLFSRIENEIQTRKFIPVIDDGQQPVQIVHVEDLIRTIDKAVVKNLSGVFPIASQKIYSFLELNEIVASHFHRSPYFIFVPAIVIRVLMKIFGSKIPVTEENLKGLEHMKSFDTKISLLELGVQIKEEIY